MSSKGDEKPLYPQSSTDENFYDTITDSTSPTYDNAANEGSAAGLEGATSPALSPEEQERQTEEWRQELDKLEDEILTLRQVLSSKVRAAGEIKRKLGITPMVELKQDMRNSITTIKESDAYTKTTAAMGDVNKKIHDSQAYQKTNAALKTAGEKTASAFSAVGAYTSKKIGDMRNSNIFKSMEEKVGGAVTNVKSRVRGSQSENSFEEALTEAKDDGPTSPSSLPEDKVPL